MSLARPGARHSEAIRMHCGAALVVIGLVIVGAADAASAQSPRTPTTSPVVGGAPNGRFQIVNGTPALVRNIMLLDTVTGDSWILCEMGGGTTGWCKMRRSELSGFLERSDPRFTPDPPAGF